jgi:ABC-type phosphate/phosphonate transport system substrate-binding protein
MPPMSAARDGTGFCFALPPSLGRDPVKERARRFADVLYGAGFSTVVPMKSVTYRSVLICRSSDPLDLGRLGVEGGRRVRAAWVDSRSMGGYILPRHHLRARGTELGGAFSEEKLLGSYEACFQAVLRGQADLTASFASRRGLGYVELCRERAFELRTLAYTDQCPNDGVVLSTRLGKEAGAALLGGLHRLIAHPPSLAILASTFDVDGFDRPPPYSYSPLLSLL